MGPVWWEEELIIISLHNSRHLLLILHKCNACMYTSTAYSAANIMRHVNKHHFTGSTPEEKRHYIDSFIDVHAEELQREEAVCFPGDEPDELPADHSCSATQLARRVVVSALATETSPPANGLHGQGFPSQEEATPEMPSLTAGELGAEAQTPTAGGLPGSSKRTKVEVLLTEELQQHIQSSAAPSAIPVTTSMAAAGTSIAGGHSSTHSGQVCPLLGLCTPLGLNRRLLFFRKAAAGPRHPPP